MNELTTHPPTEMDDTYKDVVVEIERSTQRKPYLGGYRHKVSGSEFLHASAQTVHRRKPDSGVVVYSRDTQTTEEKHLSQQVGCVYLCSLVY